MKKDIKSFFKNDAEKRIEYMVKAQNLAIENFNKPLEEVSLFDIITISGCGLFSPQKRTSFLEAKMKDMFSWTKVKPTEDRGDYIDCNDKYFELKCSSTNDNNTINILQIRPWQKVDYYRVVYFDLYEPKNSKAYILTKEQMFTEVKKIGSPTHGTKTANALNENIEYSIHLPLNNEWDKLYLDKNYLCE